MCTGGHLLETSSKLAHYMANSHHTVLFHSGIVYISHGAGEYMGRYEKLGQALADRGILAFGHDQGKPVKY